jgi:hypothetical protein
MGSLHLNAIVLVLLLKIVNLYFDILSNLRIDFYNKVSDSAVIT